MPLLLALALGALTFVTAGLVFEHLWGRPARDGALAREIGRLTDVPVDQRARWVRLVMEFFNPPEIEGYPFSRAVAGIAVGGLLVGILVFGSAAFGFALALIAVPYRYHLLNTLKRRRSELLTTQFRDLLASVSASLRAGTSLRTAIERSRDDVRRVLYAEKHTPILTEIERMIREMEMGCGVEEALVRFRDRVQQEDVSNFVNASLLCKARGGNLAEVMVSIAQIIGDKLSVRSQVQVLTAGKRMEASMLTLMPPVLVVLLTITAPDYMTPLFSTLLGQLLALAAAVMLAGAFFIGRKIMDIEV